MGWDEGNGLRDLLWDGMRGTGYGDGLRDRLRARSHGGAEQLGPAASAQAGAAVRSRRGDAEV